MTTVDAARWLDTQLAGRTLPEFVVVIGIGDGAILEAIAVRSPATKVLALEPSQKSAATFRAGSEFDAWRTTGRLAYLSDPDYTGADEAWRLFPQSSGDPLVLMHPDLPPGEEVGRAAQVLKRILFGVRANADARRRFAPRYLTNTILNLPPIVAGSDVRALADRFRGTPAVIVAAGPSLDMAIDDLRARQDHALLIATDTALRPLLTAGIAPPLVVGLDPSTANLRHFLALPECRNTWLVAESALDPACTSAFGDRTFWFRVSKHQPWPWLNTLGIDIGQIDVWGSVLTGALQLAFLAGCDPIVIVGADLSYTGGRPYARATTYEFDWAWNVACGTPLEEAWRAQMARSEPMMVADVHGGETRSTKSMVSFRDWIVDRARKGGRRVINATGAGILHGDGIEQLPLAAALVGPAEIPAVKTCVQRHAGVRPSALVKRLREVQHIAANGRSTSPIGEWRQFSGEGFDPAALSAALDAAATAVETKRRPSRSSSPLDAWPAAAFRQLAESVACFRASLTGGDGADPRVLPGGAAALERASELLAAICRDLPRYEPGARPKAASDNPHVPVSAGYEWPDAMRWPLLAFEGSLGQAVASRPRAMSAFFTAPVRPRQLAAGDGQVAATEPQASPVAARLLEQFARCAASYDEAGVVVLRPGITEAHYARMLTGTVRMSTAVASEIGPNRLLRVPMLVRPRVLTDEGCTRANVWYHTERGAVCVAVHAQESFLVRQDGRIEPHHEWPRPIVGELPFGAGGAVAWGNGRSSGTSGKPAYVMWRSRPSEAPHVEDLPFRPGVGAWWGERLYWTCGRAPSDEFTGIASWAPGRRARLELPDITPVGFEARVDHLQLEPGVFRVDAAGERRRMEQGWKWAPGAPPELYALGPHGAATARSERDGWSATAHPEADAINLESDACGSLTMTCYYPFKLAWAGTSLVVSTLERELLLFENLAVAAARPDLRQSVR
jgi:hypothetical protein